MNLTKQERSLISEPIKDKRPYSRTRPGIMQQIKDYPGRIVSVKQAYERIQKGDKSISEACTTPMNTKMQPGGIACKDNPAFRRDLLSGESYETLANQWGVSVSTIRTWKRRFRDESARKC